MSHVLTVVLECRIRRGVLQVRARAVESALHPPAERHHQPAGAMVGALAAVLVDPPAKLGELEHQRLVAQPLVRQVRVERGQPLVQGGQEVAEHTVLGALRGVRVEAVELHPEDLRSDLVRQRTGNRFERLSEVRGGVRNGWCVGGHGGNPVEGRESRLGGAVDEGEMRLLPRSGRDRQHRGLRPLYSPFPHGVCERVLGGVFNRWHPDATGPQRGWKTPSRVPGDERVHGRRQRVEIPPEPTRTDRARRIRRRHEVGAEKMRAARVRIPGPLNDREPARVEDRPQSREVGVQAVSDAAGVPADVEHATRRNGLARPPTIVRRILVGHERAQRIVAAVQKQHHQAPPACILRPGQVAQKRRGRESEREGGYTSVHERSTCEAHGVSLLRLVYIARRTDTPATHRSGAPAPRRCPGSTHPNSPRISRGRSSSTRCKVPAPSRRAGTR